MTALDVALPAATLLVSVVAGFLFAFAVVVMPGIRDLEDGDFLRAFQRIDGVIQDGDPLFGLVFVGSVVLVIVALVPGTLVLDGGALVLLLAGAGIYLGGVLVPTGVVNVPLNNRLQRLDVDDLDLGQRRAAREAFEPRWNRWNRIRTALACASAALMTSLLVVR